MSLISDLAAQLPLLSPLFNEPDVEPPPMDMLPDVGNAADAFGASGLFGVAPSFGAPNEPSLLGGGVFGQADPAPVPPGIGSLFSSSTDGSLPPDAMNDGYHYDAYLDHAWDDSRMPPVDQGDSKACGTSSLAMIMDYLGVPVSRQDIDSEIRRVDQGAMPQPLIDYAREHGLSAEGYNNGSWDEIKGDIASGIPVQALINTQADGDPSHGHFVAVVGFRTDPKTGQEQIGFRNSADGGKIDWMNRAEFENKWSNHFAGFHNFFIAYAPGGTSLPPGRWDGIEALSAMGDGAWNVMNNFDRIIHPDNVGSLLHGVIGLPGGVLEAVGGGIGFGIQTAGDWLDKKVGDVPVLGWFARPVGKVLDGIGAGIGNLFGGIGDGINSVGGAFEKLFNGNVGGFFSGLFDAGSKVVGGLFGAASSVVGGVVGAAGSVLGTLGDGVSAVGGALSDAASAVGDFFGSIF
jgi:hypothetical protein